LVGQNEKAILTNALDDPFGLWLRGRSRSALHLPEFRRAAVLVGLTLESDPRVLLTVRSSELPTHQGQISFPGGSLEAGETPVQAALREAQEEVGLNPGEVVVLGELDDVYTPFGFHVTPVLARLSAEPLLSPNAEVSETLLPRLSDLRSGPHSTEQRSLGLNVLAPNVQLPNFLPPNLAAPGSSVTIHHYFWRGHDIWGMTARVLKEVLNSGVE
jgi:8-oxo-dGTP pyrophosphatase MutT (NUDIX family)